MTDRTASMSQLTNLGEAILEGHGVPKADARLVAESLVVADAWGHPSHGMLRLPWYVARLKSGAMHAVTEEAVLVDVGALAVIDGNDGIGQIVTERACSSAVERARQHGVGVVGVRNSNHFGTAAYWTRRMADSGMVGILTTNGSPAMAPWGGREKTVGANPWSIATPGGSRGPVVLDIANILVARGKVYSALQKGEQIPDSWALDADGVPTVDPRAAIEGLLQPMAGHKGYGISFMMDILSGVLTGSGFATDVAGPYVPDARSRCGHLVIALDIETMIGREAFDERIDRLIDITKGVPLAAGAKEIFYPGEIEDRAHARAATEGVWLPAKTVQELRELADEAGVAFSLDERGAA
jgi:LDH2 family malate/lactate/ureidoglycolate dehydrogenase